MSIFLMLYIDEKTNFTPDTIKKATVTMDNAFLSLLHNEFSEAFIVYRLNDEEVNINIGKDWSFIAIEGGGNAALSFAIELNKLLNNNLYLTDSSYSFLCQLDEMNYIEDLRKIML